MALLKVETGIDPAGFARVITEASGKVCDVCGLTLYGHGPDSRTLGYAAHGWRPVPATAEAQAEAERLSFYAYRLRDARADGCANSWRGDCAGEILATYAGGKWWPACELHTDAANRGAVRFDGGAE